VPFVSNNVKPTRPEALEYYRRIAVSNHLKIKLQERVTTIVQKKEHYEIQTPAGNYISHRIIIATGFYDIPVLMDVPGENLPKVTHYYKEPHFYALQRVLVVGAQNSAVDAALETWRKGAQVTMVIREEQIGKRVKYWVKPDVENRIRENSIKAYFSSRVLEIREKQVDIDTSEGIVTIDNDYVIAMTGYKPDFAFLRQAGVELSPDEILAPNYNKETMETNQKNIYLAGVVCGGMNTHLWFIENSRDHAVKIIAHILGKNQ
jgi:thioredoxin reductase (NADPH)